MIAIVAGLLGSHSTTAQNNTKPQAGEKTGNGGGFHACALVGATAVTHENIDFSKSEFFDLWEQAQEGINVYAKLPGNYESYRTEIIEKVKNWNLPFSVEFERWLRHIENPLNIKPFEGKMRVIPDANFRGVGYNCEYWQIADWHDADDYIYVDTWLYEILKSRPRDFLAFNTHEALYKTAREYYGKNNIQDSDDVRPAVAWLFSPNHPEKMLDIFVRSVGFVEDQKAGKDMSIKLDRSGKLRIHLGQIPLDAAEYSYNLTLSSDQAVNWYSVRDQMKLKVGEAPSRRDRKIAKRELSEHLDKFYYFSLRMNYDLNKHFHNDAATPIFWPSKSFSLLHPPGAIFGEDRVANLGHLVPLVTSLWFPNVFTKKVRLTLTSYKNVGTNLPQQKVSEATAEIPLVEIRRPQLSGALSGYDTNDDVLIFSHSREIHDSVVMSYF